MKKTILILLCASAALASRGQENLTGRVLESVWQNNPTLKANREYSEARTAEAKSTNTLPDPTVGYDYLWGNPRSSGNSGELNVVQGFDFPTAYTARSRRSQALSRQFQSEYDALRQQVLLDAERALVEVAWLRARGLVLDEAAANAQRLSEVYAKKVTAGDANILEKNKVDIELMNALNAAAANRIDHDAAMSRLEALNGGQPVGLPEGLFALPWPALPSMDEVNALYRDGDARLQAARAAAEAAAREVQVARNEALPRFEVGYRQEHALGERFSGVKMGMSIPLFESRHTVRRARAQQQAARTELQATLTDTEITLRSLHAKAALLLESYEGRRLAMTPERNTELLGKALDAGQISVVDYFIELESVNLLRCAQLEIERDYRLAVAELLSPTR